jgi:hypothetical protein
MTTRLYYYMNTSVVGVLRSRRPDTISSLTTNRSCFGAITTRNITLRHVMWGIATGSGIIRRWLGQRRTRSAAVPFEAPALCMARVCDDERDGLIAILRDFANNGSAYIVPWSSLPLMAPMTDHDLALHTAVGEAKATMPAQVRAVVSDLARSGALGPEAAAREAERAQVSRSNLADAELVLILHLLNSCGADLAALMANPAHWRDADAKSAVAAAASKIGVKRNDIYRRIAQLAKLLTPIGLVTSEAVIQSGWLRALHNEIGGFGQSCDRNRETQSPDACSHLAAIADAANSTARLSGLVLNMLDYAVLDIANTIRRWDDEFAVLSQAIDRLSLMLDEWPALMKSVHDALRGAPDELAHQLRVLRSMLPHVQESENQDPPGHATASEVLGDRLGAIWRLLRTSHTPVV